MFTSLGLIRYFRMRGKEGGNANVSHVFDVALCGIKVKNAVRSLSLVGHTCSTTTQNRTAIYTVTVYPKGTSFSFNFSVSI